MTLEELFTEFPRPWRTLENSPGVVVDADGIEVFTVHSVGERADEDVIALAELLMRLGNDCPEKASEEGGSCPSES